MVQRTQVQGVSEDVESAVSRLLDLEGLAVRDVDSDAFGGTTCLTDWLRRGIEDRACFGRLRSCQDRIQRSSAPVPSHW